jgi:hypothetical protein
MYCSPIGTNDEVCFLKIFAIKRIVLNGTTADNNTGHSFPSPSDIRLSSVKGMLFIP